MMAAVNTKLSEVEGTTIGTTPPTDPNTGQTVLSQVLTFDATGTATELCAAMMAAVNTKLSEVIKCTAAPGTPVSGKISIIWSYERTAGYASENYRKVATFALHLGNGDATTVTDLIKKMKAHWAASATELSNPATNGDDAATYAVMKQKLYYGKKQGVATLASPAIMKTAAIHASNAAGTKMKEAYGTAWATTGTSADDDPMVIEYVWPGAVQNAAQMTKALDAGLQLQGKASNTFKTEFLSKFNDNTDIKAHNHQIADINGGQVSFSQKMTFKTDGTDKSAEKEDVKKAVETAMSKSGFPTGAVVTSDWTGTVAANDQKIEVIWTLTGASSADNALAATFAENMLDTDKWAAFKLLVIAALKAGDGDSTTIT